MNEIKPSKLIRVGKYIRVSTDEQAKTGDSVRSQDDVLTNYINTHENMIEYDTYIDDGVSGQKLKRDDFIRLMNDVKNKNLDLIIFTKLDRWFRNLRHYLNTQETLDSTGVSWTAVTQPYFDTSTPYGRAFVNQSMMWAELEAQAGSVRILDVFESKVKYGEVLSGNAPRGYDIVDKHLVPNDDAEIIRDIFMYFFLNKSLHKTVMYIKETYGIFMTITNLKKSILQNKKYIGEFRNNKNYCPAIVDKDLFDNVQLILPNNIKSGVKRDYIFSSLLVCKDCGRKMAGCMQNIKKPSGKRYQYKSYRCPGAFVGKMCLNRKNIYESNIEKYLLENYMDLMEVARAAYQKKIAPVAKSVNKRDSIIKKIEKLKELYVNELITLDEYKIDKEKYLSQLEEIPEENIAIDRQSILETLQKYKGLDIKGIYENLNDVEKRNIWSGLIKEIQVDSNRDYTVVFF